MNKVRHAVRLERVPASRKPGGPFASLKGPALVVCGVLGIAGLNQAVMADDFPNGCVSCHIVLKDGADKRLVAALDETGHLALKDKVAKVPADCISCHEKKSDTKFSILIHQAHFGSPETNVFVQRFGGDCRSCHTMDGLSGEAGLKGGDKNW